MSYSYLLYTAQYYSDPDMDGVYTIIAGPTLEGVYNDYSTAKEDADMHESCNKLDLTYKVKAFIVKKKVH